MSTGWDLIFTGTAILVAYAFVTAVLEAWAVYSAGRKVAAIVASYRGKQ